MYTMPYTVMVGVPFYGPQDAVWWAGLVQQVAAMCMDGGIKYYGLTTSGTMATDHNRNAIVERFLASSAEWLYWVDSDTVAPDGAVRRMLDTGKPLVSGLYYGKGGDHPPIAYIRKGDDGYIPLSDAVRWNRGEIVAVDACGMGCCLTHRSVFEAIRRDWVAVQRPGGGVGTVHKDDVRGILGGEQRSDDSKVIGGQWRVRVKEPNLKSWRWPYFYGEFGRTEDLVFFEMAKRCGFGAWVDTGVECEHVRPVGVTGGDFREGKGWHDG